jgi:acyl-CoA dehydrogenase
VISAIAKYYFTELTRSLTIDGMDVMGGAGICRWPRNLLANIYTAMPIPITVEGANILTRTMMIFGQGVIRCHPYVYQEVDALGRHDAIAFDRALWHHVGLMVRNGFRAVLLNLSRGRLARSPVSGPTAVYYRKLAWASATFAFMTDVALLGFGGSLKRQEKLTGRYADVLAWMYLSMATLRRFEAEGSRPEDLPLVHWSMQYAFAQIQQAVEGIFANLSIPVLGALFRGPVSGWWRFNPIGTLPADDLGHQIARILQTPDVNRDRLTTNIHIPAHPDEALGGLEDAFRLAFQADAILKTIKASDRAQGLPSIKSPQWMEEAIASGILTQADAQLLRDAEAARNDAIQVDSFTLEEYQQGAAVQTVNFTMQNSAV